MSNPVLKQLISEMVSDYLNESLSKDQYHYAIHTGELPKTRKRSAASKKTKPVKSYDELHNEIKDIKHRKEGTKSNFNGRDTHTYDLHRGKTSSTRPRNILKKSGWKETGEDRYKHPDGHTAEYDHFNHSISVSKKQQ